MKEKKYFPEMGDLYLENHTYFPLTIKPNGLDNHSDDQFRFTG